MLLQFLKTTKCPVCGDNTIIEEKVEVSTDGRVRTHCNGGKWEERKFSCGQVVNYVPNYSKDILADYYVCKNNPEIIEKKKKRKEALETVLQQIEIVDADEDFKARLKQNIQYISI